MRLLDRCAEFFVSEDGIGRDPRAFDDRLSAYLPGNAFNQLAFRPVYGNDLLHSFFHGSQLYQAGQRALIGFRFNVSGQQ